MSMHHPDEEDEEDDDEFLSDDNDVALNKDKNKQKGKYIRMDSCTMAF